MVEEEIKRTLQPYKFQISKILSMHAGDNVDVQNLIANFFPDAYLRKDWSDKLPTIAPLYPKSSILLLHDLEKFYPYNITYNFSGMLIVGIGESESVNRLNNWLKNYWEKILERYLCDSKQSKKIIILKNYFQIPVFQNIGSKIYDGLREYFDSEKITTKQFTIYYCNIIQLARFWRNSDIRQILAVNSGDGKIETAISKLIFPNAKIYLTDIDTVGCPPEVERWSVRQAIAEYSNCDLVITRWPNPNYTGYENITNSFRGKYIMYIGESTCDPQDCFRLQLEDWGEEALNFGVFSRIFDGIRLIIYEKKSKKE